MNVITSKMIEHRIQNEKEIFIRIDRATYLYSIKKLKMTHAVCWTLRDKKKQCARVLYNYYTHTNRINEQRRKSKKKQKAITK